MYLFKHMHLEQLQTVEKHSLSQILPIKQMYAYLFGVNVKAVIMKMDFLYKSTTLLSLSMNKNDVTHLINQSLYIHVLNFIVAKMIFVLIILFSTLFLLNIYFRILPKKYALCLHDCDNILRAGLRDI